MPRLAFGVVVLGMAAALSGCGGGSHSGTTPAACKKRAIRELVLISAKTGAVDRSFPDVAGGGTTPDVNVVLADGHGGWFVSGGFSCVGTVSVPGLVHLHADGTLDTGWQATLPVSKQNANGHVFAVALALEGNTLYAAGSSFVEALDASTGASRWQTAVDGYVSALAANGHALYVGGDFKKIADTTHPTLAALDLASGHLLAWQAPPIDNDGHTGSVAGLGLTDSRLFIGGVFTSVDGQPRPNAVAALDAKTGDVTPWRSGSVGDVETMLVAHGQVLTSGYDGWGVTNARTGKMEPWMNQVGAYRFAAFGTIAYLGGDVRNSIGAVAGMPRNNLAAIDLATNTFTSWGPNLARYVAVDSIAATQEEVLVAGNFSKSIG